jgi:peptide/nickel transport system permease protein
VTRAGAVLLGLVLVAALLAPWLSPHRPDERFDALLFAPPTRIHVADAHMWRPHLHPLTTVSLLERKFVEDTTRATPLRWFGGRLVDTGSKTTPLLLLGADSLGRDLFSRTLHAARLTLALSLLSTVGAVVLGTLIGAFAGYAGGRFDNLLSRTSEFVLVLPTIYVVLALRAVMPEVVPASQVFGLLVMIFTLLGWPLVARGVRAIAASERHRDYVAAARAIGASPLRIVLRHVLPAALGYAMVQATLLLPAFILSESTMSYVGLGFPASAPTWGTMLQEASRSLLSVHIWTLTPAAAIFVVVLAVNLLVQGRGRAPVQLEQ